MIDEVLSPTTALGMTEHEKQIFYRALTMDTDKLHVSENDLAVRRVLRAAYWEGWSKGDAYRAGAR